jgi:hypothetical protein
VRRARVRGEERVPRHGVADGHGVEEGMRGADVVAARERRKERVPGDDGAGREGIEEARSGVEASAAEECRQGAVVLADEFVGGGCNRRSGHRAGSPVRDGRREARWPSPHQEGNRRSSATWAWVGFNPYPMGSELPRQNGPQPNKMRQGKTKSLYHGPRSVSSVRPTHV